MANKAEQLIERQRRRNIQLSLDMTPDIATDYCALVHIKTTGCEDDSPWSCRFLHAHAWRYASVSNGCQEGTWRDGVVPQKPCFLFPMYQRVKRWSRWSLTKRMFLRLFKKSGSDNPLLFHYLTPLPRVNRRAGRRLVAINHGYRYLGEREEPDSDCSIPYQFHLSSLLLYILWVLDESELCPSNVLKIKISLLRPSDVLSLYFPLKFLAG